MKKKRSPRPAAMPAEDCILVLQGGGALGAYQAGVFEALAALGHEPGWLAGISIGAINAALIAGNAPERRVERLREFWAEVSSLPVAAQMPSAAFAGFPTGAADADAASTAPDRIGRIGRMDRESVNDTSATMALLFGVSGFFQPRFPAAPFQPPGTLGAISWYDTAPLQRTLERMVDFDRINHQRGVRLSVGAVSVNSGNFRYFDSRDMSLDARHVMASGALPPGFPPVEIDGDWYWDGGLVSNTPLQHVLDEPSHRPRLVFQVDLFAARGEMPRTLGEVAEREKDIRYSSRTRLSTSYELRRQAMLQAARRLVAKLPASLQGDVDAKELAALPEEAAVSVVHLIYRSKHWESQSKDYEFSRASMLEHWAAGLADTQSTLDDPRWQHRPRPGSGIHVFDLQSRSRRAARTVKPASPSKAITP